MSEFLHLYIDDSGTRFPDKNSDSFVRTDQMNHFALGGIAIFEKDQTSFFRIFDHFTKEWGIDYPLHSTKIRGKRDQFRWLMDDDKRCKRFMVELGQMLVKLPVIGVGVVIDRQGYRERYSDKYGDNIWWMCKTATAILIERTCKYASEHDKKLKIFFEKSGKREDRAFKSYVKELKENGMPFDSKSSSQYYSLSAKAISETIYGSPRQVTKASPFVQIADIYLYPICKSAYEPSYPPFVQLLNENKIIDCLLSQDQRDNMGLKFSCFEASKK